MHINIVIPYHNNKETIGRLLASLEDQDYKDFDVLITVDGNDGGIDDLAEKYPELKLTTNINKKKMGAGLNRNKGAKCVKNKGDIVFFIDADCALMPGMLTEIVTQFETNPGIDFVYGNYKFLDGRNSMYISQSFDPIDLETYNYISTMSPIRWNAFNLVGGFRDKPYFQDWDLFYRIAKAGFKGKWINECLFETDLPDNNAISGIKISQDAKCAELRKWNDIPDKNMVMTTFGCPFQAKQRAQILGCDYLGTLTDSRKAIFPPNLQFSNWKYTYVMGLFNETREAFGNHLDLISPNTSPIFHFVGTDVWHLINNHSIRDLIYFKRALKGMNAILLANCKSLRDELAMAGFDNVEVVYTPINNMSKYSFDIKAMPDRFTVGVYISDTNPMHQLKSDRSHIDLIHDIALSLPFIKFKFFGGQAIHQSNNIEQVGDIKDMPSFVQSCSALLRLTIHDGFPQLPIQFVLGGRNVITNAADPDLHGCIKIPWQEWVMIDNGYEEAKSQVIDELMNLYRDPSPRFEVTDMIEKYSFMEPAKYIENIKAVIERAEK